MPDGSAERLENVPGREAWGRTPPSPVLILVSSDVLRLTAATRSEHSERRDSPRGRREVFQILSHGDK